MSNGISNDKIAHDLAMLIVKTKMDESKITMLGELVDEYSSQYKQLMKVVEQKLGSD